MEDKRYKTLKTVMQNGQIRELSEIFDIVPKSVFVRDGGFNSVRFNRKLEEPTKFSIKDVLKIAGLIDIHPSKIIELIVREAERSQKRRSSSR